MKTRKGRKRKVKTFTDNALEVRVSKKRVKKGHMITRVTFRNK